jgi:hypothetical protein
MKETTAEWLNPMVEAIDANGVTPEELRDFMMQATMPAAEADNPFLDWLTKNYHSGAGVTTRALDWIRYGQILRERLGWTDYPTCPSDCPCGGRHNEGDTE